MNDAAPKLDNYEQSYPQAARNAALLAMLDNPDALVRAGDVFEMLNTDRSLAHAIAQHHGLVKDSQGTTLDPIEAARRIAWILTRGHRELVRRRDGEEELQAQNAQFFQQPAEPKQPLSVRLRTFLKQSTDFLEAERLEVQQDDG